MSNGPVKEFLVFGNAKSVHTFNIIFSLHLNGIQCSLVSLDGCGCEDLSRRYGEINTRIIAPETVFERSLGALFAKAERMRGGYSRYIAISAAVYGQFVADIDAPMERKALVCLGTEILFHVGRDADMARSISKFGSVICPSVYLAEKAKLFKADSARIYVRNLGIADIWFEPARVSKSVVRFEKYFVTAKYFKWIYGFETIIEFVDEYKDELRRLDVGFVFVGEGDGYRSKLEGLIRDRGVSDRFQFLDFATHAELASLLDGSLGGLYLSEYESYGVTLLECFARGKPAVYWGIPGYRDVTDGYRYGHACPYGDFSDLWTSIRSCIGNAAKDEQLLAWANTFAWSQRSASYVEALKGEAADEADTIRTAPVFVSKANILHLLEGRRDIKGARQKRTLEIYRELDIKTSILPVFNIGDSAASILKEIKSKDGVFAYVEHGSNYTSFDEEVDNKIKEMEIPVVNFLSDYHSLTSLYYLSVNKNIRRYASSRIQTQKRIKLAKENPMLTLALPTMSVAKMAGIEPSSCILLPPGFEDAALNYRDEQNEPVSCQAVLVYTGGLGPFYDLTRQLLWSLEGGVEQVFYIRRKEFDGMTPAFKEAVRQSGASIEFDKNFDHEFQPDGRICFGSILMEPIPYIKSAFPVKIMSYVTKRMPVVAFKDTEIGEIVEQNDLGFTISEEQSLSEEMDRYLSTFSRQTFLSKARTYIENNTWAKRVETICHAAC